jgi:hypothetical protein
MFDEESVDTVPVSSNRQEQHHDATHASGFTSPHRASNALADFRIAELEIENLRLQRLVAELLLKNQQLRKSGTERGREVGENVMDPSR